MIKKLYAILPVLMLTACVAAPQQERCPYLDLNWKSPDFSKNYDYAALNNFYACIKRNEDLIHTTNGFGFVTSFHSDDWDNLDYKARDYQWSLWQQIYAGKLSRARAKSSWQEFAATWSDEQDAYNARVEAAREEAEEEEEEREAQQEADDEAAAAQAAADNQANTTSTYTPGANPIYIPGPSAAQTHRQVQQQLKSQGINWH